MERHRIIPILFTEGHSSIQSITFRYRNNTIDDEELKTAEEATKKRTRSSGRGRRGRTSERAQISMDNVDEVQEENENVVLEEIEVLVA